MDGSNEGRWSHEGEELENQQLSRKNDESKSSSTYLALEVDSRVGHFEGRRFV
jgi:hypothetical protein